VREGVAAFDADRRLIAWNQTFSRMLKLPRRTLRRREALPAGKTTEIDRFNDYFETLDAEVKQTGRAALMESKKRTEGSLEIFHKTSRRWRLRHTLLDRTELRPNRGSVAPGAEA